jgi:hypothetical protein
MAPYPGRLCRAQSPSRIAMKTPRPDAEAMSPRYTFVADLADFLNIDRHTANAWIRRNGITITRMRRQDTGQVANAVTEDDAKRIIREMPKIPEIVRPEDLMK